jgi:hypothetical protein
MPFQGMCGTYFSANEVELDAERANAYLSLRFQSERGPLPDAPPVRLRVVPHAFVEPGISIAELTQLANLLTGAQSDLLFPSNDVATAIAFGHPHSAILFEVSDRLTRKLGALTNAATRQQLATRWDLAAKLRGQVKFHHNSAEECDLLLGRIVDVAADALATSRHLYFASSLPTAAFRCGERTSCDGYACDYRDPCRIREEATCHTEQDLCFSVLDCPAEQRCQYVESNRRFECAPKPNCEHL